MVPTNGTLYFFPHSEIPAFKRKLDTVQTALLYCNSFYHELQIFFLVMAKHCNNQATSFQTVFYNNFSSQAENLEKYFYPFRG
jgi:hypothetical protein